MADTHATFDIAARRLDMELKSCPDLRVFENGDNMCMKLQILDRTCDEYKFRERDISRRRSVAESVSGGRAEDELRFTAMETSRAKAVANSQHLQMEYKMLQHQAAHDKQNALLEQRISLTMQADKAAAEAQIREAELRATLSSLRARHEEEKKAWMERGHPEKADLTNEVQSLTTELGRTKDEAARWKEKYSAQGVQLYGRIKQLREDNSSMQNSLLSLQVKYDELERNGEQSAVAERKMLNAELAELRARLDSSERDKSSLQNELIISKEDCQHLNKQFSNSRQEFRSRIGELEKQVVHLEREKAEVEDKLQRLEASTSHSRRLQCEQGASHSFLLEIQMLKLQRESTLESYERAKDAMEAKISELGSAVAWLTSQLQISDQRNRREVKATKNLWQAKMKELSSKCSARIARLRKESRREYEHAQLLLEHERIVAQGNSGLVEKQLEQVKSATANMAEEHAATVKEYEAAIDELEQVHKQERLGLQESVQNLQDQVLQLQREQQTMNTEHSAAIKEYEAALDELEESQKEDKRVLLEHVGYLEKRVHELHEELEAKTVQLDARRRALQDAASELESTHSAVPAHGWRPAKRDADVQASVAGDIDRRAERTDGGGAFGEEEEELLDEDVHEVVTLLDRLSSRYDSIHGLLISLAGGGEDDHATAEASERESTPPPADMSDRSSCGAASPEKRILDALAETQSFMSWMRSRIANRRGSCQSDDRAPLASTGACDAMRRMWDESSRSTCALSASGGLTPSHQQLAGAAAARGLLVVSPTALNLSHSQLWSNLLRQGFDPLEFLRRGGRIVWSNQSDATAADMLARCGMGSLPGRSEGRCICGPEPPWEAKARDLTSLLSDWEVVMEEEDDDSEGPVSGNLNMRDRSTIAAAAAGDGKQVSRFGGDACEKGDAAAGDIFGDLKQLSIPRLGPCSPGASGPVPSGALPPLLSDGAAVPPLGDGLLEGTPSLQPTSPPAAAVSPMMGAEDAREVHGHAAGGGRRYQGRGSFSPPLSVTSRSGSTDSPAESSSLPSPRSDSSQPSNGSFGTGSGGRSAALMSPMPSLAMAAAAASYSRPPPPVSTPPRLAPFAAAAARAPWWAGSRTPSTAAASPSSLASPPAASSPPAVAAVPRLGCGVEGEGPPPHTPTRPVAAASEKPKWGWYAAPPRLAHCAAAAAASPRRGVRSAECVSPISPPPATVEVLSPRGDGGVVAAAARLVLAPPSRTTAAASYGAAAMSSTPPRLAWFAQGALSTPSRRSGDLPPPPASLTPASAAPGTPVWVVNRAPPAGSVDEAAAAATPRATESSGVSGRRSPVLSPRLAPYAAAAAASPVAASALRGFSLSAGPAAFAGLSAAAAAEVGVAGGV